jgi:hypothetical protein
MNAANTASPDKREQYLKKAESISFEFCNSIREYDVSVYFKVSFIKYRKRTLDHLIMYIKLI